MGKIIVEFSFGFINTSFLTYVSEIAPTRVRGPVLAFFTFFTVSQCIVVLQVRVLIIPLSSLVSSLEYPWYIKKLPSLNHQHIM